MASIAKRIDDLVSLHKDAIKDMQFFIVGSEDEEKNVIKSDDEDSHFIIMRLYGDQNALVNL